MFERHTIYGAFFGLFGLGVALGGCTPAVPSTPPAASVVSAVFAVRADGSATSQHLLPQSIEQPGQAVLYVVGTLHAYSQVLEPSAVHHTHVLQVHDVFEYEAPATAEVMTKREPHLHLSSLIA